MEHHSNHISWLETGADVEIIRPAKDGSLDLDHLADLLKQYRDRPTKIASVTACSNVTGIKTPYPDVARLMHNAGGYCFVDFACSAPYVEINMHPKDHGAHLDAVFFSPHKFLGGPGSCGVLLFGRELYRSAVPDQPGGGCVNWTDPRGRILYIDDPDVREDGGTPGFLQTIKAALSIRLKETMGVTKILDREQHLLQLLWKKLEHVPGLLILASNRQDRLPIISFCIDGLHYHLATRLLNDRYGIQVRGGCSCAGTYGHHLLNIDNATSDKIANAIANGDFSLKPGWVRISLHPTMSDEEVEFIGDAIVELAMNCRYWQRAYDVDPLSGIPRTSGGPPDVSLFERMHRNLWQRDLKSVISHPERKALSSAAVTSQL